MFTFILGVVAGYCVKAYVQDEVTSIVNKIKKAITK